jgi:hypothetical protein
MIEEIGVESSYGKLRTCIRWWRDDRPGLAIPMHKEGSYLRTPVLTDCPNVVAIATALTAFKKSKPCGLGLGTTLHWAPSQCSANVWAG